MPTGLAYRWARECTRGEIAELEELARVLLVTYGTRPSAALEAGRLDTKGARTEPESHP
jgi:hypothetical protein